MTAAAPRSSLTDADRWRAVLARDTGLAHRFVYAVRSTRIYCRAGCPSRRPRRTQVEFYQAPEAAERAGYRACKRCRPDLVPRPRTETKLVERAWRLIERAGEERLTLARLGRALGVSPGHLQRVFARETGISPRAVAETLRAGRLRRALRGGESVSRALYGAGYGSPSRVYHKRSEGLGMTPATYRAGGAGEQVRYVTTGSPLGRLIVAGTERGVCFVALGDTDVDLAAALGEEFPAASRVRGDSTLAGWAQEVVEQAGGNAPSRELPLDIRATAFQRRVWEELRRIPVGQTRTYTEVARRIGKPRAVRAVASACARNNVAVVIPCHRVVRADGGLGGYRWGVERKERILAVESAGRP